MSTVIKGGRPGPALKRLATVDLADHLAEARAVVDKAGRQAAEIIAEANREQARMFEEARASAAERGYEQGHAEGREAGYQVAHQEATERFDREQADIVIDVRRAITEIDAIKEDLRIAAEKHLLDFAVLVAQKLTFAIGKLHRESAVANLNRALQLVASKTDLTVRVHPDDIASMETFAKSVLSRADASRSINLVPDDSIASGGCTVLSDSTEVDATLETQVDELVSLLLGEKPAKPDLRRD